MSTQQTPERPRTRRRQLTVASVAAAVLLAGGGGAYWASSASQADGGGSAAPGGNGTPSPLVLDGLGQEEAGDGRDGGIAPGEPDPNGGGTVYRASGDLPEGPESAPVHRPAGDNGRADVTAIAQALGIDGKAQQTNGHWRVGPPDGSGPTLTVGDTERSSTWSFNRYVPSVDDKCGTPEGKPRTLPAPCPGGGAEAPSGGEPVSEEAAEQAVRPVLKALDLQGAHLDASSAMGALRTVSAEPDVGGLPAHDWTSSFTVGADGTLVRGNGHLGALVKGAEYPVMTAERTLKELNKHRGAMPGTPPCDLPPPAPDKPAGDDPRSDVIRCADTGADARTATVTGATFGLATKYSRGEPALVPSWIYEVKQEGGPSHSYTVTYPAVEPRFVKPAAPDGGETATPESGQPDPAAKGQGLTSYASDGRSLTVTFWGGVCHDYRATASETDNRVKVKVTAENPDPGRACIMVAKKQSVTVKLDEPLGDRKVVDTHDGEQLPRKQPK